MRSTLSLGSPAILWEGDARQPSLTCSSVTHAAYASASGIRVMSSGETIHSADLAEGWLLLFIAQPEMRDVPVLLVLTRRPESVRLGDGLHLTFGAGGFGALFTSRLWGARRLAPGQTTQWTREVPGDAVAAARRWSQIFLRYPVDCDEIGWMEKETVVLANRFRFRPFTSAWGTPAETLAPLAPVLPLARSAGAPLELPRDAMDLSCPTKLGPLQAVKGETTLVRIPLPPRDHRAIIPADGRMVLREAIDWATGGLHLDSKTHPDPNVRNEGSGDLHEDLAQYDIANTMPFNESPCIDVYKWWYTFNAIQARPAYSPALRAKIDRYHKIRYWETLNFYAHKCLVRQKREPFSGVEYIIHFVWPTQTQFGYRNFNDGNEASSVTASCFTAYARYYGDWTTLRANWNHCRRLHEYLPRVNDWACMSSGALEYWSNAGFDMLNSEPYGNLAFAYAAEQCGRPADALLARCWARAPWYPAWLGSPSPAISNPSPRLATPGVDSRAYHFTEDGIMAAPNKMGAIGLLDTSKGTSHELALAYKTWAGERILAEQKAIEETTARGSGRISFPDLTQRLFLGWNLAGLLEKAKAGIAQRRERPVTWNSATDIYDLALLCVGDIPLFLSEWAPAEYVSGRCDEKATEVELLFLSREAAAFTVRLYSQKEVNEVSLNSVPLRNGWRYDAASGWLTVTVRGSGEQRLSVRLGKPAAPLHPYFPAGN
ncbi:MAG: hypothetical protein IPJ98_22000 [Bryobacterales bacterium]|nr:hypothetical protein [Bryobacterales bacterium]